MASIGSVVSTAVTGGKAPVFEGVAKEVQKAVKSSGAKTDNKVEALEKEIADLKDLITKTLGAKAAAVEENPKAPAKK